MQLFEKLFESEFQSYYILFHLYQSDSTTKIEALPQEMYLSAAVQRALRLFYCTQKNNEWSGTEGSINAFYRFIL